MSYAIYGRYICNMKSQLKFSLYKHHENLASVPIPKLVLYVQSLYIQCKLRDWFGKTAHVVTSIMGSLVLSSHISGSIEPKYSANEPVLRGHLS